MTAALDELRRAAADGTNVMPASIALARAGGTTGEWGSVMRDVFGEFRAPTGVGGARGSSAGLGAVVDKVRAMPGGPPKLLVAKPGLDGHSNGAEQIAVAARDAGMEVVYSGIRLTGEQIAASARDEDPDVIGLSILSGSHLELVPDLLRRLADVGVDAPVVVGGIIPEEDRAAAAGRRRHRGLHAEGLRHRPDHGRDRRPRGGAPRDLSGIRRRATSCRRTTRGGAASGRRRRPAARSPAWGTRTSSRRARSRRRRP